MSLEKTKDPEIKRDARSGIFHYRGTPIRGGGEITRSLGVRTFGSAQLQKKDLLLRLRGVDPRAKDVPFGDYVKVFLGERKKRSEGTFEEAFYSCKELLPFYEIYTMRQAANDLVWGEYKDYQAQLNPGRELSHDRKILYMMFLRLKEKGILTELPALELEKRPAKRKRVLTSDETGVIFERAKGTCYGLALFMFKMGARPGEVLGARWQEFDLRRGLWSIPEQVGRVKPGKSRTIKLNRSVWDYLLEREKKAKGPFVFPGKDSNGLKPIDRYNKQWKRLMALCNLQTAITPYYLRHTFLTECAKKVRDGKLSLVLITKYAGTSIEEFERTYLHIEGEDTKAVAEMMEVEVGL